MRGRQLLSISVCVCVSLNLSRCACCLHLVVAIVVQPSRFAALLRRVVVVATLSSPCLDQSWSHAQSNHCAAVVAAAAGSQWSQLANAVAGSG